MIWVWKLLFSPWTKSKKSLRELEIDTIQKTNKHHGTKS